ncbi:MAG: CPBP family intramembrane glutamic endopeptidase [Vicinamibacteraceae bacterium]
MADASSRLLPLAVIGEGGLAIAGGVWLYAAAYPVAVGATWAALGSGVAVAAGLALVQWWLQTRAPHAALVRDLRDLQRTVFEPLFGSLSVPDMVAISALAGVGEEMFFRGALQAFAGWPIATLAFGACHLGLSGRGWVLGAWAAVAGAVLAWLAIATGGLVAPIVAHAGYDLAALLWIRRQARIRG